MRYLFDHQLFQSFTLYIEHSILQKGSGFVNNSGLLYKIDSSLSDYSVYASPFKQWVSDYSVSGALVPSGIYVSGSFIPRGSSGVSIDYNNGRVLLSGQFNNLVNVSGHYSIKEYNIYPTDADERILLFNTQYQLRTGLLPQIYSGNKENFNDYPCIWVKYIPNKNEPFAMGGLDEDQAKFRLIVLSSNFFNHVAVCNVLRDLNETVFGLLSNEESPFNGLGDIKSGQGYNYNTLVANKAGLDQIWVKDVQITQFSSKDASSIGKEVKGAIVDFDLAAFRYPRS